jgi:ABC-type nitrate/sulfonate/bicarbonate transport system substrate-binding protein
MLQLVVVATLLCRRNGSMRVMKTTCACKERGMNHLLRALTALSITLCTLAPAMAAERPDVRIAGSAWVGDAPTWVADGAGYFKRNRTEHSPRIEVQLHASGYEALQHLLDGEAEFALAATTPTALALIGAMEGQTEPASIAVLASVALSNQSHMIVTSADGDIHEPGHLAGRRVGIMFGTSSHYGWSQFSAFHGIESSDIELVDLRVADMAEAMRRDRIDAAVLWQPWELSVQAAIGSNLRQFPMRMLYTINWLLVADRDFVTDNPEVNQRILQAYIDAIELMHAEPERARELHSKAVDVSSPELAERSDGMIWRVGMNWSVLVNLGTQFEWLSTWPELEGIPIPRAPDYLSGSDLLHVAPERVTLPAYLIGQDAPAGRDR